MTSSKPRPNHPVGCNGHYCTRFSSVRFSGRPTANHVPTTRLRTTVKSVQRSVPYLSLGAQQETTSQSLCYKQRAVLYNDQYHTYLPTPNSDGRPDHSVGYNGYYRTRISTVPISGRKTANRVPANRLSTIAIAVQRSVSCLSPDSKHQTTSQPPG